MGKKHKKHHKSEKRIIEQTVIQEPSQETKPLKLVLKVSGSSTTAASSSYASPRPPLVEQTDDMSIHYQHEEKKKKHKKKKKKKDKDREKHWHLDEEISGNKGIGQLQDAEFMGIREPPRKKLLLDSGAAVAISETGERRMREPRACTLREEDDNAILRQCLHYLHKNMQKKDVNGFFAFPVTDAIAPGYSAIIPNPMDFSTMLYKIENDEYHSVMDYKKDLVLMFTNATIYNRPETIYNKEAKRLLILAHKQFTKEKLLHMKKNLSFLANLTLEELGLDENGCVVEDQAVVQEEEQRLMKEKKKKAKSLSKFEAIPDSMTPEEILAQAQAAARYAQAELTIRKPESKFGFLRRREDGTVTFNFMNPDNDGKVSETERVVSLGSLVGKLNNGLGSIPNFKEDKRNKVSPVNYLPYWPFSSHGPQYDSSFANVSKEEADILLAAYGDETGLQYAKSVMNFVADSSDYAIKMVDNLLDILTKGEHTKAQRILEQQRKLVSDVNTGTSSQDPTGLNATGEAVSEELDFSLLSSMNKEITPDTFQKKLDHTAALLTNLIQVQTERLSQRPPAHLSHISGPSEKETELAESLLKELNQMAKVATPNDIVDLNKLRAAIGITTKSVVTAASGKLSSDVEDISSDAHELFSNVGSGISEGTGTHEAI